jgi:Tfp pilus assembly protein PilN
VKAVNLIPNEQRGPGKAPAASAASTPSSGGDGFGAYAILGLLAFAVIAAALYVMATNKISENKADLARVQAESQVVQQQAASLQSFADFKTLADARTATVRSLAVSRFDWDTALDDVSRALPSDVYVSSLDGTTSSVAGGSSIRGALSAPAIELVGCTGSQTNVARLMARLRNVRGVSRVSLSSSIVSETAQQPATAAAAPAPTSGDGTGPTAKTISEACPKGSPPYFDMVVFFERSVVAPAAAPNGSATTATAGPTGAAGAPTGPTGTAGATTPASTTTTP